MHTFNPSTWGAEAGGSLSSRPAWSTEWVPGQPELHRETLSWKKNYFILYIWVLCLHAHLCPDEYLLPWIPWTRSYRQLWAAMWLLRTEHKSSRGSASALRHPASSRGSASALRHPASVRHGLRVPGWPWTQRDKLVSASRSGFLTFLILWPFNIVHAVVTPQP